MFFDERQEVLVIKLNDVAIHQPLLYFYLNLVDDALVLSRFEAIYLLEGSDNLVELYISTVGSED